MGGALAALLKERSGLENGSSFHAHGYYHIGKVIEATSDGKCLFDSALRKPLKAACPVRFQVLALAGSVHCRSARSEGRLIEVATRASRAPEASVFNELCANINDMVQADMDASRAGIALPTDQRVDCELYFELVRGRERRLRLRETHSTTRARGESLMLNPGAGESTLIRGFFVSQVRQRAPTPMACRSSPSHPRTEARRDLRLLTHCLCSAKTAPSKHDQPNHQTI